MRRISLVIVAMLTGSFMLPAQLPDPLKLPDVATPDRKPPGPPPLGNFKPDKRVPGPLPLGKEPNNEVRRERKKRPHLKKHDVKPDVKRHKRAHKD